MRNVDDSIKDSILRKFNKYYQELIALKRTTDYSQKDNLKNIQSKILEIIEQYALSIQPYEREENDSKYNEALYLLTVFADELYINTAWNGENIWEDNLLEEQLFQSHYSGEKFFEMIDNNLHENAQDNREMSVLYLLFLSMGFKGRFMFSDSDKKLNYYKKQLFMAIYKTSPLILKEMKLLFPEAYTHNLSAGTRVKFYNIRLWVTIGLVSILIAAFLYLVFAEPDTLTDIINSIKYFFYEHQTAIIVILFAIFITTVICTAVYIYKRKELFQRIRKKVTRFEIRESIRLLSGVLAEEYPNPAIRNEIPIYLALGSENSGNTTLIKTLKIKKIADSPFEEFSSTKSACNWFVYDRGIIIDPASKMDANQLRPRLWKYFIRRLRKLRRLRPIDGIILTVSYEDLSISGSLQVDNLTTIKLKTDNIYSKLIYIQKKLRMHLPVYIIITKCDKITGFDELIKKLPNEYDHNICGWSSPYNSNVVSYTKNWILEAFQNINMRLTYLLFGLCIDDAVENDFIKIYNLRNEIDSVKYPIQILTNKIFSIGQNTLLAPLLLRGIYFTGSKSSRPEDIETAERAFSFDVIDKKIFRESQLAKPARKIIIY